MHVYFSRNKHCSIYRISNDIKRFILFKMTINNQKPFTSHLLLVFSGGTKSTELIYIIKWFVRFPCVVWYFLDWQWLSSHWRVWEVYNDGYLCGRNMALKFYMILWKSLLFRQCWTDWVLISMKYGSIRVDKIVSRVDELINEI